MTLPDLVMSWVSCLGNRLRINIDLELYRWFRFGTLVIGESCADGGVEMIAGWVFGPGSAHENLVTIEILDPGHYGWRRAEHVLQGSENEKATETQEGAHPSGLVFTLAAYQH